ncbi:MAG: hypothetical protein BRC58_04695 [Cyanobacteria bacterium QS_8_64_29]|nr:MAG: hypothetical protein BRC58_04695 [Cyanobacteria bacterium QS_8_64_29]
MPPRWSRPPTRTDPDYRRLADRINWVVHLGAFAATNSGLWFFHNLQQAHWAWAPWLTGGWGLAVLAHAVYAFALAERARSSHGRF